MLRIVARRLLTIPPMLLVVSLLAFVLVQLIPGDAAATIGGDTATPTDLAKIRSALGLDRPLLEQYLTWLGNAAQGDLGTSLLSSQSVAKSITAALPVTLSLACLAGILALSVGVGIGIVAALHQGRFVDRVVSGVAALGVSAPPFWLALILVAFVALRWRLAPATGYVPLTEDPAGWFQSVILPASALAVASSAAIARQTRAAMIDVLATDYVRLAHAKGLSNRRVVAKHALKNAGVPVVTVLGVQITALLGGAVIIEQIFAVHGLGSVAITAVNRRDLPMIQGVVVISSVVVVVVNLLVDLVYGYLDPRLRST